MIIFFFFLNQDTMHYDEMAAGNVHAALGCQVSCLSLLAGVFCRARPSSALTLAFKSSRSPVPAGANLSSSQKRPENVFRGNTLTRLEASALGGKNTALMHIHESTQPTPVPTRSVVRREVSRAKIFLFFFLRPRCLF